MSFFILLKNYTFVLFEGKIIYLVALKDKIVIYVPHGRIPGVSKSCWGKKTLLYLYLAYSPIKDIFSCYDLDDLFILVIMHFNKNRSLQSFDNSTYYFHTDGLDRSVVIVCIYDY
jgi:hypothetical protein